MPFGDTGGFVPADPRRVFAQPKCRSIVFRSPPAARSKFPSKSFRICPNVRPPQPPAPVRESSPHPQLLRRRISVRSSFPHRTRGSTTPPPLPPPSIVAEQKIQPTRFYAFPAAGPQCAATPWFHILRQRSEEHTSELQSHSFISYAVF